MPYSYISRIRPAEPKEKWSRPPTATYNATNLPLSRDRKQRNALHRSVMNEILREEDQYEAAKRADQRTDDVLRRGDVRDLGREVNGRFNARTINAVQGKTDYNRVKKDLFAALREVDRSR